MAPPRAKWEEVTQRENAPCPRSSHALAVVGDSAYIFGGELEPRTPIDNDMHVFDLVARKWSVAPSKGQVPAPRVGVAMAAIGDTIFVFGGRDSEHEELNELFSFHVSTGEWALLTSGEASPPHRSYHALAADAEHGLLFTFGGCGKNGRRNDLWAFDIKTSLWKALPAPPEDSKCVPRGGPALAAVGGNDAGVWVLFGFNGQELGDTHKFSLGEEKWEEVEVEAAKVDGELQGKEQGKGGGASKPRPRSVLASAVIGPFIVAFGGEVDPSDLGHMGAGNFTDELLLLDTRVRGWVKPLREAPGGEGKNVAFPEARGWMSACGWGENKMVVYGGMTDTNGRLDDMWVLSVAE